MGNDEIRTKIMDEVDEATHPEAMGWKEAKEFLEEMVGDLQCRIEALVEENEED
jgi:hypothetical protein